MARGAPRGAALGIIVAYKATKAVLELAAVAGLLVLATWGEAERLAALAAELRTHLASRWAVLASRAVDAVASRGGLRLLETGLALDGLLTAVEGWSLWRGYRWGPWLVIGATTLPLPWELWEIARRGSWSRLALTAANLAVVAYLVRRAVHDRRERASGRVGP